MNEDVELLEGGGRRGGQDTGDARTVQGVRSPCNMKYMANLDYTMREGGAVARFSAGRSMSTITATSRSYGALLQVMMSAAGWHPLSSG